MMKFLLPIGMALIAVGIFGYFLLRSNSERTPELRSSYEGPPADHSGEKTLLVAVYAKWASVWSMTAQVLSELDREKYDLQLIDSDADPEKVKSLGIKIVPTVIIVQNGKEVSRHPNLTSAEQLSVH